MERQPTNVQIATITELNTLLNQLDWDAQQASYLEGERVNLLLDPMPSEIPQHVHVPLTIIALEAQPAMLTGARIELQQVGNATLHYGHLSQRGQLLLHNLPLGTYQLKAHTALESTLTVQRLGAISAQTGQTLVQVLDMVALPAHDPRLDNAQPWQFIYHDADGSLKTSIQRQSAEQFNITFESPNRKWDGALLAFTWQAPYARLDQRSEPILRFAVMRWDITKQICTAELQLTATSAALAVCLPVKPYPPKQITNDLLNALQLSVQDAATEQARQGWRDLLETVTIPANIADALRSMLDPTPRSLWRETAASVFQLMTELRVEIGRRTAQFVQMPASLTPQPLATSATRAHDLDAAQGQVLTLDSPEHDFSINLSILPGQQNKTAILGIWINQGSVTNASGQMRIILRDEDQHILASESIASDGRIDFSNLAVGVYRIEVKQRGKTWQWSVPVTVPDEQVKQDKASDSAPEQRSRGQHENYQAEQLSQTTNAWVDEEDEQKQVRRHTNIDFPTQCQLDQPTKLLVQLTLHPIAPVNPDIPPHRIDLQPTQQAQVQQSLELLVMVSSRGFTVEPAYCTMKVPFEGDSEQLEFQLTGHQLGDHLIEVRFFHETARVGYVGIKTTVVAPA